MAPTPDPPAAITRFDAAVAALAARLAAADAAGLLTPAERAAFADLVAIYRGLSSACHGAPDRVDQVVLDRLIDGVLDQAIQADRLIKLKEQHRKVEARGAVQHLAVARTLVGVAVLGLVFGLGSLADSPTWWNLIPVGAWVCAVWLAGAHWRRVRAAAGGGS